MSDLLVKTSAPGKLFLFGEYGVLTGGWSVLAAVGRRVSATRRASPKGYALRGAEVDDARALPDAVVASGAKDISTDHLQSDVSALFDTVSGEKLGLGSSAASAVALSAACSLEADSPAVGPARRAAIFERAFSAHRELQGGRGSGADIASSSFGGVIAYRLRGPVAPFSACPAASLEPTLRTDAVELTAGFDLPDGVRVEPLWLGSPARSTSFVRRCEQAHAARPDAVDAALCRTSEIAERAIDALGAGSAGAVIAAADEADRALDALGELIEAPIVTDAHRALRRHARDVHIAVKPSGAGGGDFSLAFGPHDAPWESFLQTLPAGIRHLPLELGVEGVRAESVR